MNNVVYNYLKEYSKNYSVADLKNMILYKGYSEADYAEALAALKMTEVSPVVNNPAPTAGVPQAGVSVQGGGVSKVSPAPGVVQPKGFKWIFLGFFCGIVLTLFALYALFSDFLPIPEMETTDINTILMIFVVLMVVFIVCKSFVFLAFRKIGKYSKGKMLSVFSLVLMIIFMLMVVVGIGFFAYSYSLSEETTGIMTGNAVIGLSGGEEPTGSPFSMFTVLGGDMSDFMGAMMMAMWEAIPLPFKMFFGLGLFLCFIYLIGYIFFSVGLIKIRKETKLTLTSGILRLILTLIVLGIMLFSIYVFIRIIIDPLFIIEFVVSIMSLADLFNVFAWIIAGLFVVVYLFETIVLFLASRKYEKK